MLRREPHIFMEATKLAKLLIDEVSGVDSPANLCDGWMVAKSAANVSDGYYTVEEWGDADKATWSTAYVNDLPDSSFGYVAPGGKKDAEGKTKPRDLRHIPYKDADGKVDLPHVRAALSRLGDESNEVGGISASARKALVAKLQKLLGEDSTKNVPSTPWERIRNSIFATRKDDIDMTSEELTAALDERDEALVEKFAEVVKSAVAPVEGAPEVETTPEAPEAPAAPAETPAAEAPAALTADEITKAIQEALAPYNEILEKVIDRFEPIERQLGVTARQSLEGQEGKETTEAPATPATKSAIATLLSKPVGSSIGSCPR